MPRQGTLCNGGYHHELENISIHKLNLRQNPRNVVSLVFLGLLIWISSSPFLLFESAPEPRSIGFEKFFFFFWFSQPMCARERVLREIYGFISFFKLGLLHAQPQYQKFEMKRWRSLPTRDLDTFTPFISVPCSEARYVAAQRSPKETWSVKDDIWSFVVKDSTLKVLLTF